LPLLWLSAFCLPPPSIPRRRRPRRSRCRRRSRPPPYLPFQHLPAVPLDEARNGWGVAQQTARAKNLQGRLLWIDATANLDRVNSADKIAALVGQIRRAGFNTICFDIKPIIGQTLYPSRYAPKMTEWRKNNVTQTLRSAFDPLAEFVRQTRAAKIGLVVNMNAFSEGHRDYGKGPGYERPEWQTVLYEEQARLRVDPTAAAAATQPLSFRVNELPAAEDEVAVYTDRVRLLADLPKRKPESAVVALVDAQARVGAQIAGPSFVGLNPAIPPGGAALVGTGASAEFLRRGAVAGQKLSLETMPNYVRIGERPRRQVPLMTNPFHPGVRQRLLDMIAEVTRNYAIDGVIFDDRLRYAGLDADFSPETRQLFERYVGRGITWPDDVFRYRYDFPTMARREVPGPYYDAWLVFRALNLRNWLAQAVTTVKSIRPRAAVATYVGSWYPTTRGRGELGRRRLHGRLPVPQQRLPEDRLGGPARFRGDRLLLPDGHDRRGGGEGDLDRRVGGGGRPVLEPGGERRRVGVRRHLAGRLREQARRPAARPPGGGLDDAGRHGLRPVAQHRADVGGLRRRLSRRPPSPRTPSRACWTTCGKSARPGKRPERPSRPSSCTAACPARGSEGKVNAGERRGRLQARATPSEEVGDRGAPLLELGAERRLPASFAARPRAVSPRRSAARMSAPAASSSRAMAASAA
jgi:uncharacterized lipoprotein YddW (UPF0748 family)